LSFHDAYKYVMFGGDWARLCNVCHVYKGQDIKIGAKAKGRNALLCVTLNK